MHAASAIYVQEDLIAKLQGLKRHPVESYNSVIERLVTASGNHNLQSAEEIKGLETELDEILHHLTILKRRK
jgi:hypothetical protein